MNRRTFPILSNTTISLDLAKEWDVLVFRLTVSCEVYLLACGWHLWLLFTECRNVNKGSQSVNEVDRASSRSECPRTEQSGA
jgi:hypothetical protein